MKRTTVFLGMLAAAAMTLFKGQAVEAAPYDYTVRIFAGTQGTFKDGKTVREYKGTDGEVRVLFDWDEEIELLPESGKYYVKGIKRSGVEEMANASFSVKEDADYVVVYGIRRDMVGYVVRYEDAEGNTLAESKHYEGNVGDTPIVGHVPIEGYVPQAYNLSRTLREDEEENVFVFVYTRVAAGGGTGGGGGTITEEVTTTTATEVVVVPGVGTAGVGAGGASVSEAAGGDAAVEAGAAAAEGGAAPAEVPEPEELINLDDEETPLAGSGGTGGLPGRGPDAAMLLELPPAVYAGLASALALLLAGLYLLAGKRKKERKDGDE